MGPKLWDLVPNDIKLSKSLSIFKRKIKKWASSLCPCRLCKTYLQHEVFIEGTPEKSMHKNGAVALSVFLLMCNQMCVCPCVFQKDSISFLVTQLSQLVLCYY